MFDVRPNFRSLKAGLIFSAAVSMGLASSAGHAQPAAPAGAPPSPAMAGGQPAAKKPNGEPVGLLGALPQRPVSPAQRLVAQLPPPQPGTSLPLPDITPGSPLTSRNPRDFQGTWSHNQDLELRIVKDMYGFVLPYTMAGAKVVIRRVTSLNKGIPYQNASALCRPPGELWQTDLNTPFQVFQTKKYIEFIFLEYHGRWYIDLDPKADPAPNQRVYMGHSVGHWDGDTLIVTTTGFKAGNYLDPNGTPLSANATLVQRIRKVDHGGGDAFLEIVTTVNDPIYYTKPWSVVRTFGWAPSLAVLREYNCEEQIGDPTVDAYAGIAPEPTN